MSAKPKFNNARAPKKSDQVQQKKELKKALVNQGPENEKIKGIYDDVMEAQEIMAENIQKMTDNIDQAEDIAEKTEQMVEKANTFKKQSKSMKKNMCWRKWKLRIMIIGIAVAVVAIIVIIIVVSVVPTSGGDDNEENATGLIAFPN